MNRLIDAKELAEKLGVPTSWVYRAAREGRIPSIKLGKYVRFDPEKAGKAFDEELNLNK